MSEQLVLLCDTRLEGGPEGLAAALEELLQEEVESLLGEALDALLDAQNHHERELRRLAERLQH